MKSSRKPISRHREDPDPHDQRLGAERQAFADVRGEPAAERGADDRDAAHRRRALLGHVVLGAAILLAEDRLAEPTGAEQRDQRPRWRTARSRPDTMPAIMTAITWPLRSSGSAELEQDRTGDLTVVERQHLVADELIRLVALAGDDHHVARLGERDPQPDRRGAVGFDLDAVTVAVADPRQDLVDDRPSDPRSAGCPTSRPRLCAIASSNIFAASESASNVPSPSTTSTVTPRPLISHASRSTH